MFSMNRFVKTGTRLSFGDFEQILTEGMLRAFIL